jgi:hypothetical protein
MIRQLCYLSTVSNALDALSLSHLAESARRYNAGMQLTGLLAQGGGFFFQVLEGPRDNVCAAFGRICRDRRHHDIRLLQDDTVTGRDFAGMSLALAELDVSRLAAPERMFDARAIPMLIAALNHDLPSRVELQRAMAAA